MNQLSHECEIVLSSGVLLAVLGPAAVVEGQLASRELFQGSVANSGRDASAAHDDHFARQVDSDGFTGSFALRGGSEEPGLRIDELCEGEVDGTGHVALFELSGTSQVHQLRARIFGDGFFVVVTLELLNLLEEAQLLWLQVIREIIHANVVTKSFSRLVLANPLRQAAIEHSDVLMTHGLEHPSSPIAHELHVGRIVDDDRGGEADVVSLHGVDELLLVWHHERKVGSHVAEVFQVEELGADDVFLDEVDARVVAS